jgi:hypothetical protein
MQTQAERDLAAAAALTAARPGEGAADEMVEIDGQTMLFADRQPFGAMTQKLAYPAAPGMHNHWFNDEPGRLDDAKNAGYKKVVGKDGNPVRRVVDKTTGQLGYLHEIPESWYKADLAAGQKAADEKDSQIALGNAPDESGSEPGVGKKSGFYGGVKISRK